VALLDPELTLSQPPAVAAATGIDALSHAVESFVTVRRNPVSRAFAREAWRLLSSSFERVLDAGGNLEARGRMLLGASLAGMAIENSMLGAAHAAANPLTTRHGVVHGNAVGVMLPHVVRFNAETAGDDYRELAALAGAPAPPRGERSLDGEALARLLEGLLARSGLPTNLRAWGIEGADLPDLAREAAEQWTAGFNPRPAGAEEFLELYRCAL
jgi:alcohol dehydrogenase